MSAKIDAYGVISDACYILGIAPGDIITNGRKQPNMDFKRMVQMLLRVRCKLELAHIAKIWGKDDSTFLSHAYRRHMALMQTDDNYSQKYRLIESNFYQNSHKYGAK